MLSLSSDDVKRFESASSVLVTPLAYPDIWSWGSAAMELCARFLGADQSYLAIWTPTTVVGCGYGAHTDDGAVSYKAYYWRKDFVITERLKQLALGVYHRDMLYRQGEIQRDEVYNDWSVPHKFCDTIGMSLQEKNPDLLAGITFYHDTEAGNFREIGVDMLRLLHPAFKAGMFAWLTFGERRDAMASLLDDMRDGVLLTDVTGEVLHRTASLGRTLAADPESDRVMRALSSAAQTLAAVVRRKGTKADPPLDHRGVSRSCSTTHGRYRVTATYLPEGVAAPQGVIASVLTRETDRQTSAADLRSLHGLTARECEVAKLLAKGMRNDAIAAALGISANTALRHTERVLRKLGIHSRAAVAAALHRPSQ